MTLLLLLLLAPDGTDELTALETTVSSAMHSVGPSASIQRWLSSVM